MYLPLKVRFSGARTRTFWAVAQCYDRLLPKIQWEMCLEHGEKRISYDCDRAEFVSAINGCFG